MGYFLLRRLAVTGLVFLVILVIAFWLVRLVPGDPVRMMISPEQAVGASPDFLERRRRELGLDRSAFAQFVAWFREILNGNWGYSFAKRVPVAELLGQRIVPTSVLAFAGLAIGLAISIPAGVFAAFRHNRPSDYLTSAGSMLVISTPSFFLALAAIYVFAVRYGVLPSAGLRSLGGGTNSRIQLEYLVLPASILGLTLAGPLTRFVRTSMLEVMGQDYMTMARAKGLSQPRILMVHGLRNASLSLITVLGVYIPGLLAGVVILEEIFAWPGIGRLILDASQTRDYPVLIACIALTGSAVLLFNLLADIAYAWADPRIRLAG